jgi:FkbM family methyltransferase
VALDALERGGEPSPFHFALIPKHTPEQLLANVRYALSLGLPDFKRVLTPHDHILSVAGGGPSLEDTYSELTGYVVAVNETLRYLLEKGVTPQACGVCDPNERMADLVVADPKVTYFIASCCHPKLFDKLIAAKCRIFLWQLQPIDGLDAVLQEHYGDDWPQQILGGPTMGTRWLTLGYHLGFRKFNFHGLDSSFRGKASHAYPDHQDTKDWINFDGYDTRINFVAQAQAFIDLMEDARFPDVDPIEVKLFGEGLLQTRYAHWLKTNPPFEWPKSDVNGRKFIMAESRNIPEFLRYIPNRRSCIQAGGNVGVYPRALAKHFDHVSTFEPNRENFECLLKNTNGNGNITKKRYALGEFKKKVGTASHEEGNAGAVHVTNDGEDTIVAPIDDMVLDECDLIWLDVEGYEEPALRGADRTIKRFKPAVIIEEKSILADILHGLKPEAASDWLKRRQYYRVAQHGNDCLYVYGGP